MGLKRNSKGEIEEVKPLRTRKGSIYTKGSNTIFRISRSKFSNFLECKRCFYLERVKGLKDPGMPGWSLNSAVDELLKKEFDELKAIYHSKDTVCFYIFKTRDLRNEFVEKTKGMEKTQREEIYKQYLI